MRERKVLVYCFPYPTKKHNEENLRTKYEALKEPDQNRPNKEVTIQFNVATSALATWKKNEKIYQAFQSSSLKWQRVKVVT